MSNSIKKEIKNALTVGRIADYCLVSRSTVRRWLKDGRLNGIRLPSGHYRVSMAGFRVFLEQHEMPIEEWLFESESEKEGGDS
jgi:excisionase family DNA binding protein